MIRVNTLQGKFSQGKGGTKTCNDSNIGSCVRASVVGGTCDGVCVRAALRKRTISVKIGPVGRPSKFVNTFQMYMLERLRAHSASSLKVL